MNLITFGLAFVAYLFLCTAALTRRRDLAIATAVVAAAHVACVWIFRSPKFGPGFVIFHAALAAILVAPFRWTGPLLLAALLVVTAGAIGATFKYPEVRILRFPVAAAFVAAVVRIRLRRRSMAHDESLAGPKRPDP